MRAGPAPDRIAGLDGLRALSVIAVVLTHAGVYQWLQVSTLLPLMHGSTGVRVFFVLSGFLITRLMLQEHDRHGRVSYARFIMRRALRIFPLYVLFLSIVTALWFAGLWKGPGGGLAYAWAYAYNFAPVRLYDPVLGHTWSLAVEEHFYVLWPFVLAAFAARPRRLLAGALLGALACLAAYSLLVRLLDPRQFFFERWTVVAAFSLLVGCLAAILERHRPDGAAVTLARSRVSPWLAALLFAAPSLLSLSPLWGERVLPQYLAASLQSVAVALLVLWLQHHPESTGVALLEWQPLKYVGTISYGIYIWQGFFLGTSPERPAESAWPPPLWVGLPAIALVAPLSYHAFERPFLALKARFVSD